jgi:hypothetical protein
MFIDDVTSINDTTRMMRQFAIRSEFADFGVENE